MRCITLFESFLPRWRVFGEAQQHFEGFYKVLIKLFQKKILNTQNFNHDGYKNHKTLWMLASVPKLEEFVHVVEESRRGMVEDVILKFQQKVLAHIDDFPQQMIHGDFNEQNILVNKSSSTGEYKIAGFIDFGDSQYSCLLFELAIAMAYMMLITGDIETGGYFLAGYRMNRLIPENEMNVLKVSAIILRIAIDFFFLNFAALRLCSSKSKPRSRSIYSSAR